MGEGYVHQGHFFRMSSHDVTNVLPWPRPGCVTYTNKNFARVDLARVLVAGDLCVRLEYQRVQKVSQASSCAAVRAVPR